ncbi:MAG: AAA family ATPase [Gammaproteobacteria bacterium]|nr:AAA family ATPase [Gammaproteobacteria bacterium]
MRIARLYLRAFGAFSARDIEFVPAGVNDLQLIFGPNEAGKSTILRAVTGLLFQIPERTDDRFLHGPGALQVGATLQLADGTRRSLLRRMGRKHTLFALDETTGAADTAQPIPEQQLTELLGGLDRDGYQHLFGLDLHHLIEGGEELLRGEGEVGRSLFQAAAGIAGLRELLAGLATEAEAIFKPRGSLGRLNRALREFDEQKRALREATVRTGDWDQAERALRDAEAAWQAVRATQQERRGTQLRLTRIRANLPLLAERAAIAAERATLPSLPALPVDAATQRVRASESLRLATAQRQAAAVRLQQSDEAAGDLVIRAGVLEHAGAIEQGYHALGEYQAAQAALAISAAQREMQQQRLRQLLAALDAADLAPDAAGVLLPPETLVARVRQLGEDWAKLADRIEQLETQAVTKRATLRERSERLAALPEDRATDVAERLLPQVAHVAELEARRQALAADCAARTEALRQEAAALWPGPLDDLLLLPLPLAATVEQFAEEFGMLAREQHTCAEGMATLQRDRAALLRQEQTHMASGAAITRAEVSAARVRRDDAWHDLRATCIDAAAPPPVALARERAAAVEAAIETADSRADQLHADAGRSAEIESIRRRLAELEQALRDSAAQQQSLRARGEAVQARWSAVIAPLACPDLTPGAAREWLQKQRQCSEHHGELARQWSELERLGAAIGQAGATLDRILLACGEPAAATGETLVSTLERARHAVAAAQRLAAERATLAQLCDALADECRQFDEQLLHLRRQRAELQPDWEEAMRRLRLPASALPAEARARLEQLARLATVLSEGAALAADAARQRHVVEAYQRRLDDLARACGEPHDGAPEQLAERLYAALASARTAASTRQRLEADAARERQSLAAADAVIAAAEQTLATLLRCAGCDAIEQLPAIEAAALRQAQLAARAHDIEEQLLRHNACAIAEVVAEAAGLNTDDVARQLESLEQEIELLDRELETAQDTLFRARTARAAIDGGGNAADAAQTLASIGARIAQEARAYARVRLAGAVLDRVMQVYRERHQGPLLHRAAEVFARITLGSFSGLAIDHDDGHQVLTGVRPSGSRVTVAGMSQGTRDQLYLALRLAAIEQHLAERGPFPVIVDDLLVQFDDARALATLALLVELSARTQVLCFTHHRHLRELVAASPLAAAVTMQSL